MAIYHLHVDIVSRSKGQSVIAAAAYRSASRFIDAETGEIQDYTKKNDVEVTQLYLPSNAPEEYQDRNTLWNAVAEIEKAKDAQLARVWNAAFPIECTNEECIAIMNEFGQNRVNEGMIFDCAFHNEEGNPHMDAISTMRSLKEDGSWDAKCKKVYLLDDEGNKVPLIDSKTGLQKVDKNNRKQWKTYKETVNDWDKEETLLKWRKEWEVICNKYLDKEHQISCESYATQGIELEPTIHEGSAAREMEQRGEISDRCERNRQIMERRSLLQQINDELRKWANIAKKTLTKGYFITRVQKAREVAQNELEVPKKELGYHERPVTFETKIIDGRKETIETTHTSQFENDMFNAINNYCKKLQEYRDSKQETGLLADDKIDMKKYHEQWKRNYPEYKQKQKELNKVEKELKNCTGFFSKKKREDLEYRIEVLNREFGPSLSLIARSEEVLTNLITKYECDNYAQLSKKLNAIDINQREISDDKLYKEAEEFEKSFAEYYLIADTDERKLLKFRIREDDGKNLIRRTEDKEKDMIRCKNKVLTKSNEEEIG